jgi:hypothetical protein
MYSLISSCSQFKKFQSSLDLTQLNDTATYPDLFYGSNVHFEVHSFLLYFSLDDVGKLYKVFVIMHQYCCIAYLDDE